MTNILMKRGPTAKVGAYTGSEGELVVDTTKKTILVQDGKTAGGIVLAKYSDIPTKISQLANDVNFSQLTSANATVDANIGTPSVTVSVTGSGNNKGLKFDFKNLKGAAGVKGEKGDTGPQGPQGIQGPQGPAGALSTISGGARKQLAFYMPKTTGYTAAVNYGSINNQQGKSYSSPVVERDAYGRVVNVGYAYINCDCNCNCDCSTGND